MKGNDLLNAPSNDSIEDFHFGKMIDLTEWTHNCMKRKFIYLIFAIISVNGCSSKMNDKEDLPFIDVNKKYPEKELIFNDFADVSYIHLNTDNDDYLYKSPIMTYTISKNTIVVYDVSSCSILFFSRDGTPKSRFKRLGQGPEEYMGVNRILYDEDTDEVFIADSQVYKIQVYSSSGQYKRTIPLPIRVNCRSLVFFDTQSFLVYCNKATRYLIPSQRKEHKSEVENYTTYYHISKTNGAILDSLNLPSDSTVFLSSVSPSGIYGSTNYSRLSKGMEGFYLCNPETDTVYLYNMDKSIIPVFRKAPSVHDIDPIVVITNVVDIKRYQFFRIETIYYEKDRKNPRYPDRYYFRDKETDDIYLQKIILPEYKGKEFNISADNRVSYGEENGLLYELDLIELKQANEENRLSRQLKELVDTLNELDDNNVLMFVQF